MTDRPMGIACYCRGTAILTDAGERPIESLRIGDHLVTVSGAVRRLRWVGRRGYAGPFLPRNPDLLPIRFAAGSLGVEVPRRDLFVSPAHAMFLDGMLIPAAALVDGGAIARVEAAEMVEYFHLELATHDVILAEGAPSETFLDAECRFLFHNAADFARMYPKARAPAGYCAPRVVDGPAVAAVRERLAALATPWIDSRPGWRGEDWREEDWRTDDSWVC